jgi:hypothetical protein
MARENPSWGYDRIVGALANLGHSLSDQTVGNILRRHGISPAPKRKQTVSWKNFIRSHLDVLVGMDFFTTEVLTLKGLTTYNVLFFIHLESRQVKLAGFTPYPDQEWMERQARNMTMEEWGSLRGCRYLLHDRDAKFPSFRELIKTGSENRRCGERSTASRSVLAFTPNELGASVRSLQRSLHQPTGAATSNSPRRAFSRRASRQAGEGYLYSSHPDSAVSGNDVSATMLKGSRKACFQDIQMVAQLVRGPGTRCSSRQQDRKQRLVQDRARDATEHPLSQLGVAIGAHDEEISAESGSLRQQKLTHVFSA